MGYKKTLVCFSFFFSYFNWISKPYQNNWFKEKETAHYLRDSSSVRLMTYNVHHFKQFGSEVDSNARNNILDLINEEQPDVIAIQEFLTRKRVN